MIIAFNFVAWIPIGIVVLLVFIIVGWVIKTYNLFVGLRNKVRNNWSQIDIQLKRRFDLIPNLVETAKGYAKHEKDIFTAFAEARTMYHQASESNNVELAAKAESGLSGALTRLLAVSEQYPELKANTNFQKLMGELSDTEDKITYARQFYNDSVMRINNQVEMFPSTIVASMFHFKQEAFFEITHEAHRENVKVQF
ncbi:MAG: LemA family protein [Acholeplasmataceae bacterium]|nr:LemA family protein [Acholeplasmataceae bacterium]